MHLFGFRYMREIINSSINMQKIVFLLLIILQCACSTCNIAKHSPIREIHFGNGGGFSGTKATYCLKADGSLWKQEQMLKKLSCDSLSSIYELAEQLPHEDFIHPSNTYCFIKLMSRDTTYYYAWVWENIPNEKIVELYIKLGKQL